MAPWPTPSTEIDKPASFAPNGPPAAPKQEAIDITVREIKRLLAAALTLPKPPGHAARWLHWRLRHQARSRWFHQRARLARNYALVN
jgi:hypothetical protein